MVIFHVLPGFEKEEGNEAKEFLDGLAHTSFFPFWIQSAREVAEKEVSEAEIWWGNVDTGSSWATLVNSLGHYQ